VTRTSEAIVPRRRKGYAGGKLATYFWRNGYVRRQNLVRVSQEGPAKYKKGDEVRLVAQSEAELEEIRRLLWEAGLEPGRPFAKGRQIRQPIYGREQVSRFLELIRVR